MQISPKVGMYVFGAIAAIAAGGAAILPTYVPPDIKSDIVSTCITIMALGGAGFLSHYFSSSTPGPGAPQDPAIVKAVADGASPKAVLAIAQNTVNASSEPAAATEPNSPLQPKG